MYLFLFFLFKQQTAYEMRISDWSSDVCSSDLIIGLDIHRLRESSVDIQSDDAHGCSLSGSSRRELAGNTTSTDPRSRRIRESRKGRPCNEQIGRASGRERVGQYV